MMIPCDAPTGAELREGALKPGACTATLLARNAKGASKPVVVKFTVVK